MDKFVYNKAKEKLFAGEALDDAFVGEVIMEKLRSPEVYHYGMQC